MSVHYEFNLHISIKIKSAITNIIHIHKSININHQMQKLHYHRQFTNGRNQCRLSIFFVLLLI